MAKILVTGSAGAVGRPVCRELLLRGHEVRALDRVPTPEVSDSVVVDIVEREAVREAVRGCDAVVHLAAQPVDVDFSLLVGPNVIGLYNVMAAAQKEQVKRVVLASSVQVLGRRDRSAPASTGEASPSNHYGLTKLWAEQMGQMYARRYGMSVVAVRIAWLVRNTKEARHMLRIERPDLYLSSQDAGRFFARAVTAENIEFAVVYAASRGGESLFDMEPARRLLGYEARDRWPEGLGFELPQVETD